MKPTKGKCRYCKTTTPWRLGRTIASNGISLVYWICSRCNQRAEKNRNIPHSLLKERSIELKSIKIIDDFSETNQCARCCAPLTEYHHWAPRHLFEDADHWPGDYLCKECHKKWHDVTTPEMCKK